MQQKWKKMKNLEKKLKKKFGFLGDSFLDGHSFSQNGDGQIGKYVIFLSKYIHIYTDQ